MRNKTVAHPRKRGCITRRTRSKAKVVKDALKKNKMTKKGQKRSGLELFGCDPKVFTYSQPVRVPGAFRDGRLQRLVWLRE